MMLKTKRKIEIGLRSDEEFFDELKGLADCLDDGWMPDKPVERLYFDNLPALLEHLTPKRFELLAELRRLGLVDKDKSGHFYVPWDEIDATFRLAA